MILEVQAVAPPNARSWFIEENIVSGECHHLAMDHELECYCRWEASRNDTDRSTVPFDTTTHGVQAGRENLPV